MEDIVVKAVVECTGTFFLCFTIALAKGFAGYGIGCALMCAIYFGGHISGANYNPAVSFALLVRGALDPKTFGIYVVAQLLGAMLAALLAMPVGIGHPAVAATTGFGFMAALIAEIVLTFALCHVVIHTATTTAAEGKYYYGLAIGFTVMAGAMSVGAVSG